MRTAMMITIIALMTSCAAKKPIQKKPQATKVFLDKDCVIGWMIDTGKCRSWKNDLVICDSVVAKTACVKIQQR